MILKWGIKVGSKRICLLNQSTRFDQLLIKWQNNYMADMTVFLPKFPSNLLDI